VDICQLAAAGQSVKPYPSVRRDNSSTASLKGCRCQLFRSMFSRLMLFSVSNGRCSTGGKLQGHTAEAENPPFCHSGWLRIVHCRPCRPHSFFS